MGHAVMRPKVHVRFLWNEGGRFHVKPTPGTPRKRSGGGTRPTGPKPEHRESVEKRHQEEAEDLVASEVNAVSHLADALVDASQNWSSAYSAITADDPLIQNVTIPDLAMLHERTACLVLVYNSWLGLLGNVCRDLFLPGPDDRQPWE